MYDSKTTFALQNSIAHMEFFAFHIDIALNCILSNAIKQFI